MPSAKESEKAALGEAHLYAAIVKADGKVSKDERARAPYYAKKSQELFNILDSNKEIKKLIKSSVEKLLDSPEYFSWDKEQHLNQAIKLLKASNTKTSELIMPKNSAGLLNVAKIDGYILKESKFIREIEKKLEEL